MKSSDVEPVVKLDSQRLLGFDVVAALGQTDDHSPADLSRLLAKRGISETPD